MVYKLMGEIPNANRKLFIDNLCKDFKFMIKNGFFYIALTDYKTSFKLNKGLKEKDRYNKEKTNANVDNYIKTLLKEYAGDNAIAVRITSDNIMNQDEDIKEWLRDNLVALDKQRYQFEQQEKLKAAWQAMDNMEDILRQEKIERYNQLLKEKQERDNNKSKEEFNNNTDIKETK